MRKTVWQIILMVTAFTGFLLGYAVPPLVEVGMIGGGPKAEIGIKSEVDQDLQDYYRDLHEQD